MALSARADLKLLRAPISEPGRYYHAERAIVIRQGLLLAEERRHLWHELVHADRGDLACQGSPRVEASVEREAVRRALPLGSLLRAFESAAEASDVVDALRLPHEWIQFRLDGMHPAERAAVRAVVDERDEGVA